MSRTRSFSQDISFPIYCGTSYLDFVFPYGDGSGLSNPVSWSKGTGTATLSSSRCDDETHPGPPYRSGGGLNIFKYHTDQFDVVGHGSRYQQYWAYKGGFLPSFYPSSYLSWGSLEEFIASNVGDVEEYGAKGYNMFSPTKPAVDLGVALAECKDIPRTLRTTAEAFKDSWKALRSRKYSKGLSSKELSDDWLTFQFGWLPFVNDVRRFYKTTCNVEAKLNRLRKNNGKWERRGGTVNMSSSTTRPFKWDNSPSHWPTVSTYLYNSPLGRGSIELTTSHNVWFEGAFKYWLPGNPYGWYWNARAVALLYGLNLNPSVLWEYTPWSWLIDYWSNVGDVISNITTKVSTNLASKYAYVMGTFEEKATFYGQTNFKTSPVYSTCSASFTRKSRVAASPFGFGLTSSDLTGRQLSILSALGLSRLNLEKRFPG